MWDLWGFILCDEPRKCPLLTISAGKAFVGIIGTSEIVKSKPIAKGAYMHAVASCGNVIS